MDGRDPSCRRSQRHPKRVPELSWAEHDRFRERSTVERVFSRLENEFGGAYIRVPAFAK
jgi:hypothetical protein